jgi:transcriptional regulator of arginine metabolism
MQICDKDATIMHLSASEVAQASSLWTETTNHILKSVPRLMLKRERQKKILNLIRAKRIGTQEMLRAHLERSGVPVTQSSVSRDLEELGVIKHHGAYALPQANGGSAVGLLSLDVAGDVLVIARCLPGRASAVAVEIDDAGLPEIVGTLAGEDTIFIAVRDQKAQRAAIKKIWELIG